VLQFHDLHRGLKIFFFHNVCLTYLIITFFYLKVKSVALQSKLKINHDLFAFSEFFRDSSKKNELFFDFAARKFGSLLTYSYLCSVRTYVLTIQVSFLRGQAAYVTTQFIKPYINVRLWFCRNRFRSS
jgi:hypothetical protein